MSFEPSVELKAQFKILDTVESTNNYAMARIRDGLAQDGEAWFTHEQTQGRGQMGKSWVSEKSKNLLMTVITKPKQQIVENIFHFNACISIIVRDFIQNLVSEPVFIKWPNDIYIRDRKAGGMLIENRVQGKKWKWSVIGLGLNINQKEFEPDLHATSLYILGNRKCNPEKLARALHQEIMDSVSSEAFFDLEKTVTLYNSHLYKKNENVKLIINDTHSTCKILGVCNDGMLQVEIDDDINKVRNGEIIWKHFEV